jgi:alkylation response protein AidB-like acyl-CoA dehydrogenase
MDFELNADDAALQEAIRKQLAARFPTASLRALADQAGVDRARWRELGDAGVFGLRLDEASGGAGLGMTEAVLVYEELGRALVPGPLVWTHLAAGVVDGAASGDRVVGGIERREGPLLIENRDAIDTIVVVDERGISLVPLDECSVQGVDTPLDPLTPVHLVRDLPAGSVIAGPEVAAAWRRDGATLTAALLLGISEAVTDLGVAYAKQRVQFDKPIGAFQAVKHLLADMLVRTEMARAAVYAAGVTIDDPSVGDPLRAARAAKLLAGEAAILNSKSCVQVYGGMGFTWEVDVHLFLKRAWVLDTAFGSADHHAEALSAVL